jgi:DNA-binding response OmpR family regulator
MREDDVPTTTTEEETKVSTTTTSKPKAKRRVKAKAKKAKTKTTKRAKTGNGRLALDEDRKDKFAAALRIRADSPRAKLVEHLAKGNGKTFTAEQLAKLVDWTRRQVQHFVMVRIPSKAKKYSLKHEVISDGEGSYGLKLSVK